MYSCGTSMTFNKSIYLSKTKIVENEFYCGELTGNDRDVDAALCLVGRLDAEHVSALHEGWVPGLGHGVAAAEGARRGRGVGDAPVLRREPLARGHREQTARALQGQRRGARRPRGAALGETQVGQRLAAGVRKVVHAQHVRRTNRGPSTIKTNREAKNSY